MAKYKNHEYFLDKDGLWKVVIGDELFVVALDDSKEKGRKCIIWKNNSEECCKRYIDHITKTR